MMRKHSFWTTGENLTNMVQDLWVSNMPKHALIILMDGFKDFIDEEDAKKLSVEILTGKAHFVGDSRTEEGISTEEGFGNSSFKKEDLFSPQEQYFLLEKKLSSILSNIFKNAKEFYEAKYWLQISAQGSRISEKYPRWGSYHDLLKMGVNQYKNIQEQFDYLCDFLKISNMYPNEINEDVLYHAAEYAAEDDYYEREEREKIRYERDLEEINKTVKMDLVGVKKELKQNSKETLQQLANRKDMTDEQKDYFNKAINAFDKNDRIVEDIKPGDINDTSWTDGLITPKGVFYPCGFQGHSMLLDEMIEQRMEGLEKNDIPRGKWGTLDVEKYLSDKGWIHISSNRIYVWKYSHERLPKSIKKYIVDYISIRVKNKDKFEYNGIKYTVDEFMEQF